MDSVKAGLILLFVSVAVGYFTAAGAADGTDSQWVRVDKAIDGDTVILRDGRHVRLIGIDAPEIDHREGKAEPWAVESWQALGHLVNGRNIRLAFDVDRKDSHGRVLAYLFDEKGGLINRWMIDQGLAHVLYVAPNIKAFEMLLMAQRTAMDSKEGVWQHFAGNEGPWTGNQHSKRFHRAQCPLARKIRPDHKVVLKNRLEAFRQGYAPCRRCITTAKKELKPH